MQEVQAQALPDTNPSPNFAKPLLAAVFIQLIFHLYFRQLYHNPQVFQRVD